MGPVNTHLSSDTQTSGYPWQGHENPDITTSPLQLSHRETCIRTSHTPTDMWPARLKAPTPSTAASGQPRSPGPAPSEILSHLAPSHRHVLLATHLIPSYLQAFFLTHLGTHTCMTFYPQTYRTTPGTASPIHSGCHTYLSHISTHLYTWAPTHLIPHIF